MEMATSAGSPLEGKIHSMYVTTKDFKGHVEFEVSGGVFNPKTRVTANPDLIIKTPGISIVDAVSSICRTFRYEKPNITYAD